MLLNTGVLHTLCMKTDRYETNKCLKLILNNILYFHNCPIKSTGYRILEYRWIVSSGSWFLVTDNSTNSRIRMRTDLLTYEKLQFRTFILELKIYFLWEGMGFKCAFNHCEW